MFSLTNALKSDAATGRARGTVAGSAGTKALRAKVATEYAEVSASALRSAHYGTPPRGLAMLQQQHTQAVADGDDARAESLSVQIDAITGQQSAYWDELVWSSDLGASGHFIRSIHFRALTLDLIGYKPEDTLADAVEVAYANMLRQPAGTPAGRIARELRVKKVTAELRRARMTDTPLPITRGEVFRAVRYAYKRGLNAFAYTKRGQVPEFTSTGLTSRLGMTASIEKSDARAERTKRNRAAAAELTKAQKMRAQGWIVETRDLGPVMAERTTALEALEDKYPVSAAQLPLRLAQALVNGYTVAAFLAEVAAVTGKTYSEQTLTRWANTLGAL